MKVKLQVKRDVNFFRNFFKGKCTRELVTYLKLIMVIIKVNGKLKKKPHDMFKNINEGLNQPPM